MGINYITKKYKLPIKVAIAEITGIDYEIEFILPEQVDKFKSFKSKASGFASGTEKSNLNPNYTFESFVVGNNNKFAHAASLAVAESPGEVYNPLYIYGGPGLGKTHLMQSIGHFILQQQPEKKVIYVTSEEFTNEVIDSIRNGNASAMTKLRDKYRTVIFSLLLEKKVRRKNSSIHSTSCILPGNKLSFLPISLQKKWRHWKNVSVPGLNGVC